MADADAKYYVGLSLLPGIGPVRFIRLIDRLGSASRAWHASASELRACGVDEKSIPAITARRSQIDLEGEVARVHRLGARVLTWHESDYPDVLRQTFNRPAVLYVKGSLKPEDAQALAIVGTRRPSVYGQALTVKITPLLVENGLTIISGLATGVDAIAHRAALQAGGRTIAVLGSGLDVVYPSQNRSLAERICENGAVVTEYPMGTQPDAFNFPARNRIISGLSLGALIVEAGEKSGALLTAGFALEQNREVFAFPGRVTDAQSAGCNRLIKQGRAKLVTGPEDILDELNLKVGPQQLEIKHVTGENEAESKLLSLLSTQPVHIDDLGRRAALPASDVTSTLTLLELRGAVRQVGSMHYILAH